MTRVLLIGAETMVGAEVLAALLREPGISRIRVLLPAGGKDELLARLERFSGPFDGKVRGEAGELEAPRFGLEPEAWQSLAGSLDVALHCAERHAPDDDLEAARRSNLRPVEEWLRLLERQPAMRLVHLSTTFVGGTRQGLFTEFDLDCGQGFHNAYERSKYEAELRLRESSASPRISIVRPSHTLGSARTGTAFDQGGFYPLLGVLGARRRLLPGDPEARIDLVPADVVAASLVALVTEPETAGGTYHAVAGWRGSIPVRELVERAASHAGSRGRRVHLAPRAAAPAARLLGLLSPRRPPARFVYRALRDYLGQGCVFDDFLGRRVLAAHGIAPPLLASYLEAVLAAEPGLDTASRAAYDYLS